MAAQPDRSARVHPAISVTASTLSGRLMSRAYPRAVNGRSIAADLPDLSGRVAVVTGVRLANEPVHAPRTFAAFKEFATKT
jgi:hypothetical protein